MKPDEIKPDKLYLAEYKGKECYLFTNPHGVVCYVQYGEYYGVIPQHEYGRIKIIKDLIPKKAAVLQYFPELREDLDNIKVAYKRIQELLGEYSEYDVVLNLFNTNLDLLIMDVNIIENKLTKELRDAEA